MSDRPDERDNPYEPVGGDEATPDASHRASTPSPDDETTAPPVVDRTAAHDDAVTSTYDVRQAERDRAGAQEADRSDARLSEHRSAAYLTGERPPEPESGTETAAPGAASPGGGADGAGAGTPAAGHTTAATAVGTTEDGATERDRSDRDILLEGTTALTRPPSRTGSHVLTVLLSLVLTPVTWYLLADAGARFTLARANPWETGNLNPAALLELAGGLLVLAVVLLAARWSSLGATVTGVLVLAAGVPFVAAPAWVQESLEPAIAWLDGRGDLGGNVAHHLVASGSTGRFVVYGVALVLVGAVSHGARRRGRREVRPFVESA